MKEMLKHIHLYTTLFLLPFLVRSQSTTVYPKEAVLLAKAIANNHYRPKSIDDGLSREVFEVFLKRLDGGGLYLTASDIVQLNKYQLKIDDEFNGTSWELLPAVIELYKRKVLWAEKIINELLDKPFNFNEKEQITFRKKNDTLKYSADDKSLALRWKKWLKYQALLRITDENDSIVAVTDPRFIALESSVRKKLKTIENGRIKKIIEHASGFEHHLASLYFNSFCAVFDPHTNYFPKIEKENFEAELSPESFSFGFSLEENEDGAVIIDRLLPGGPVCA